jgi:hypothetical protein
MIQQVRRAGGESASSNFAQGQVVLVGAAE